MKPIDDYIGAFPVERGQAISQFSAAGGVCPYCGGSGILVNAKGEAEPCACYLERLQREQQGGRLLAPALREMTLDNFSLSYYPPYRKTASGISYRELAINAKEGAALFIRNIGRTPGLFFTGEVGCGKTHLAAACANALLQQQVDALFLVVPDFLDDLRASYGKDGEFSEAALMRRARSAAVLILDDLGAHNFSEWTQNKLYSLVNHRVINCLPMVVTSNLSLGELEPVIGSRTTSRLAAACRVYPLLVERDIRLAKNL